MTNSGRNPIVFSTNYSLIARSAVYQDPFLTYAAAAGTERYQLPVSHYDNYYLYFIPNDNN